MEERKGRTSPNAFTPAAGVLVLLLSFVLWMNFGSLAAALFYAWPASRDGILGAIRDYITVHIPFILMFAGLLFGSNAILKTRLRELAGGNKGFRWRLSLETGAIYLALSAALTLLHIQNISPNTAPAYEKLSFLLPVLLLTPMQAVSEEIFFRALPARIIYGSALPLSPLRALPYSAVCGLLFLLPHLWNPEMHVGNAIIPMIYYFMWGFLAAMLSIATGGFEAATAMHAANNLYIALLVNYPESAMPTEALFIDSTGTSDAATLAAAVAAFIVIYAFSLWRGHIREGFRWQGRKRTRS